MKIHTTTLTLSVTPSELIECPSILVERSCLLSTIEDIEDETNLPVLVPDFVSKELLMF